MGDPLVSTRNVKKLWIFQQKIPQSSQLYIAGLTPTNLTQVTLEHIEKITAVWKICSSNWKSSRIFGVQSLKKNVAQPPARKLLSELPNYHMSPTFKTCNMFWQKSVSTGLLTVPFISLYIYMLQSRRSWDKMVRLMHNSPNPVFTPWRVLLKTMSARVDQLPLFPYI